MPLGFYKSVLNPGPDPCSRDADAGGEACTDIEYLHAEPGLLGGVASDSTLYWTITGPGLAALVRRQSRPSGAQRSLFSSDHLCH